MGHLEEGDDHTGPEHLPRHWVGRRLKPWTDWLRNDGEFPYLQAGVIGASVTGLMVAGYATISTFSGSASPVCQGAADVVGAIQATRHSPTVLVVGETVTMEAFFSTGGGTCFQHDVGGEVRVDVDALDSDFEVGTAWTGSEDEFDGLNSGRIGFPSGTSWRWQLTPLRLGSYSIPVFVDIEVDGRAVFESSDSEGPGSRYRYSQVVELAVEVVPDPTSALISDWLQDDVAPAFDVSKIGEWTVTRDESANLELLLDGSIGETPEGLDPGTTRLEISLHVTAGSEDLDLSASDVSERFRIDEDVSLDGRLSITPSKHGDKSINAIYMITPVVTQEDGSLLTLTNLSVSDSQLLDLEVKRTWRQQFLDPLPAVGLVAATLASVLALISKAFRRWLKRRGRSIIALAMRPLRWPGRLFRDKPAAVPSLPPRDDPVTIVQDPPGGPPSNGPED